MRERTWNVICNRSNIPEYPWMVVLLITELGDTIGEIMTSEHILGLHKTEEEANQSKRSYIRFGKKLNDLFTHNYLHYRTGGGTK